MQGSWIFAISPACPWRRRIADSQGTLRVHFYEFVFAVAGAFIAKIHAVLRARAFIRSFLTGEE
jgi:hypothetical protein